MSHKATSAAPASRPIHPCVLSIFEGTNGGEYATWAYLTTSRRRAELPNLITAQNASIRVYEVEQTSGTLILVHSFPNLAGSVCFLETLSVDDDIEDEDDESFDSLIVGFSGHPRLVVATLSPSEASSAICASPTLLLATTLLDLTAALVEHSLGSVAPLEHDLIATIKPQRHQVTLCVVLGGGVAVATIALRFSKLKPKSSTTTMSNTSQPWQSSGWIAGEPYLLPLANLQRSLREESFDAVSRSDNIRSASLGHAISTGFGDILSAAFLPGYLEPTIVLLHSNPIVGRTWSGRLGRPNGAGGARGCLVVTAIIVTVPHQQSALLWSIEVPTDTISLHPIGNSGVLIMSVNSILVVSNSGRIEQMLAVNGWARSGCPARLLGVLQPNPWPFPKLSVQLDGAKLGMVSDRAAFLTLRQGQIYLLQHCDKWSLMPIGQTIGAVGEMAALLPWRFQDAPRGFWSGWSKAENARQMSMGLLFAGSRLGDSHLLGYVLESNVNVKDFVKKGDDNPKVKMEDLEPSVPGQALQSNGDTNGGELDREVILLLEEAALYAADDDNASSVDTSPHTIPPSDDENESSEQGPSSRKRHRSMLSKLTVMRSLMALDTITSLGPIGPGCEGPLAPPPLESQTLDSSSGPVTGATAHVFPCGYGSSGGIALVTAPGRDDRSILAEADCFNVDCLFGLPRSGVVLLGMSKAETGIKALRFSDSRQDPSNVDATDDDGVVGMHEVDLNDWLADSEEKEDSPVFANAKALFREAILLSAAEIDEGKFVVVVSVGDLSEPTYAIVVLSEASGSLTVSRYCHLTDGAECSVLLSLTPLICEKDKGSVSFCCLWKSGNATVVSVSVEGIVGEGVIRNSDREDAMHDLPFYESQKIVAVDLFNAPEDLFDSTWLRGNGSDGHPAFIKSDESIVDDIYDFDDDDFQLYGTNKLGSKTTDAVEDSPAADRAKITTLYVAVCRQSGRLEVYTLSDVQSGMDVTVVWSANGCGHGVIELSSQKEHREPGVHEVHTSEFRFFFCGSSPIEPTETLNSPFRSLSLLVETTDEDLFLYKAISHRGSSSALHFGRVPLGVVSRRSQEQARHYGKLRRKAMVGGAKVDSFDFASFRHCRLHRFTCLSGQDGAFAAVSRPLWIVSERGKLTALCHRTRHASPAGGRPWPVVGFCPEVPLVNSENSSRAFLTLHDRVGRVGSQRLTIFRSVSNLSEPHSMLSGGGFCVEKIPLGVTVKRIEFINDSETSSGIHPLYAVLVARELATDQKALNDDGLTAEERQRIKDEKEAAKIKRQVEADLGGFELEQEWVEEIEREDCFKVETTLGGAPPNPSSAYSLWVVDAARKWNVVDSFEFGDNEYALTMQLIPLSEFGDDSGQGAEASDDIASTLFLCVGTGKLTQDGEDVTSKGRLLLFEVKRPEKESLLASSQVAELSLVYEKEVLHGPVSSLSCLSSEGRNRLVIGAGADINVEQWGNGRLTQVGFFRATMQILDITQFRNFLLLSDAYDSMYFLVWRESDKSLTLLSKDYEPTAVYAAGILTRGGSLTFVCHDDRQNLQFFQYAPGDAAARGGNKLVCRADFHLGSQSVGLQTHMCRSSLLISSATHSSTLAALKQQDALFGRSDDDQRIGLHFGTSDGSFGSIVALSEPVYWRLAALQSVMGNALETECGLSQRAWRLYRRTPRRGGCRANDRKKGVIDGEVVLQFSNLALSDQEDLASAIGSSVDLIMDNLLELRCASMII